MSLAAESTSNLKERQQMLGRFEEAVMLATIACGTGATAEAIRSHIETRMGASRITTIITTLDRLTDKGLVQTHKEDQPAKRKGGKKRMIYAATVKGVQDVSKSLTLMTDLARAAGLIAA